MFKKIKELFAFTGETTEQMQEVGDSEIPPPSPSEQAYREDIYLVFQRLYEQKVLGKKPKITK